MTKSYKAVDTLVPPNQNPGYATVPFGSTITYNIAYNKLPCTASFTCCSVTRSEIE